jgi:hypothetical protein
VVAEQVIRPQLQSERGEVEATKVNMGGAAKAVE